MSSVLTINLDLDGVIADFQNGWADRYEEDFGQQVADRDKWDSCFTQTHFATEDDFWRWTDRAGIWEELKPLPGARGGIYHLCEAGHTLNIVTNRHPTSRSVTEHWVNRIWPHPHHPTVHLVKGDKSVVPGAIYVDDSPTVLNELRAKGKFTVRFNHPWNRGVKATMTADNWLELVRHIDSLVEENG